MYEPQGGYISEIIGQQKMSEITERVNSCSVLRHRVAAQIHTTRWGIFKFNIRIFVKWVLSWFRDLPGEDGLAQYQCDDAHDSIDPQTVTRVYGNAIEKGDWRP